MVAVQRHSATKRIKNLSICSVEVKFNADTGFFVESKFNRALAAGSYKGLDTVTKEISDFAVDKVKLFLAENEQKISESKSEN